MARHEKGGKLKASVLLGRMQADIKSLNSSVLIVTQKMKYLVRNEKILGRNLIVLNKKLKSLEEKIASGNLGAAPGSTANTEQVQEMQQQLDDATRKIAELGAGLQQLREASASKEELKEMHYVVDSINPLQFATLDQVKDLIKGNPPRKKKKK